MAKPKGKKKGTKGKGKAAATTTATAAPAEAVTTDGGDTTTAPTTTATPNSAWADLLGSDPNAPTERPDKPGKGKKGKKGKKGSKGTKGKKGKKKKKKEAAETTEREDTAPQYTQADIDEHLKKREKERKRRREDRLVNKMKDLVTIVRADDFRWNTYSLAPLYQFIRRPDVEVVTAFFHKEEIKREEKKLLFADNIEDDAESYDHKKAKAAASIAAKSVSSVTSSQSATVSTGKFKRKSKVFGQFRGSKGWAKMSMTRDTDGLSLIVLNEVVPNSSVDMFYFVKLNRIILDKDNFFENTLFGNIPGGHVASLHSLLTYVFAPMFSIPGVLPESECDKLKYE